MLLRWRQAKSGKWVIETRCNCGKLSTAYKGDLVKHIGSKTYACKSCTISRRNKRLLATTPEYRDKMLSNLQRATLASMKRGVTLNGVWYEYTPPEWKVLLSVMTSAKQRCTNKHAVGYDNYGGRGIEFRFPDVKTGAEWIQANLGFRPTNEHSIDRVDVNGHYEPGNLRWATRAEQANNKRAYKRSIAGERIRAVQRVRKDLCYETIRYAIKKGYTNEQIINKPKEKQYRTSV